MKTILITGGTGDLGSGVVPQLASQYRCVVVYRSRTEFDRLKQSTDGPIEGIEADLQNEESVRAALERSGSLFALVHLVGAFEMSAIESTSLETWNRMVATNTTAAFLVMRAAIRHLERGGRIVAVSSAAAIKKPPGLGAYIVSKAALDTLVDVLAVELRDRAITVNAILPTVLDTPPNRSQTDPSKLVPLERVAETILFLLSEAGGSVTGSHIVLGT